MRHELALIPFGAGLADTLAFLPPALREHLPGLRSAWSTPIPLRPEWWDHERDAVRSAAVLRALIDGAGAAGAAGADTERRWTLGVVDAELFVPGRLGVFGEAVVEGCCAVIGIAPLRSRDPARFRRRVLVEAVHELGHLAGLGHCRDPSCVMWPSADLLQTDRKRPALCASCAVELQTREGQW